MAQKTLYVLYNADGTVMGKLKYGYRKLASKDCDSACAACDITHGGLSLSETPKWVESKKEIEGQGLKVVQWHRDEISPNLKDFVNSSGLRYPAVVLDSGSDSFTTVMTSADLNACGGDPKALVNELYKKDVLTGKKTEASL
ncbi:hypothetical protein PMZ80_010110 [Knufia obscura]|uniref:Uncharacterized protein n=2 Tax=Knufia TaxID=430999 RepID=A0AAN8I779_9EURO|nr:hypothetical protein PMZ80_010110 [Knufia obscura]KAK5952851.1 hypothetical protein OHC33_005970 [Knufia fluminis]